MIKKTEIVTWSPPGSLKSNGSTTGGILAKSGSTYVYSEYGTRWKNSIADFISRGVAIDYTSIQNEPDIETSYDSCRLIANEDYSLAGYNKAFAAVTAAVTSNQPMWLVPETMGFGNAKAIIDAISDKSKI